MIATKASTFSTPPVSMTNTAALSRNRATRPSSGVKVSEDVPAISASLMLMNSSLPLAPW